MATVVDVDINGPQRPGELVDAATAVGRVMPP